VTDGQAYALQVHFCATCAFDDDAYKIASLPAWTAHSECQENRGPLLVKHCVQVCCCWGSRIILSSS
jgi:hypothetical protein